MASLPRTFDIIHYENGFVNSFLKKILSFHKKLFILFCARIEKRNNVNIGSADIDKTAPWRYNILIKSSNEVEL